MRPDPAACCTRLAPFILFRCEEGVRGANSNGITHPPERHHSGAIGRRGGTRRQEKPSYDEPSPGRACAAPGSPAGPSKGACDRAGPLRGHVSSDEPNEGPSESSPDSVRRCCGVITVLFVILIVPGAAGESRRISPHKSALGRRKAPSSSLNQSHPDAADHWQVVKP
jgi:hypothetical protein